MDILLDPRNKLADFLFFSKSKMVTGHNKYNFDRILAQKSHFDLDMVLKSLKTALIFIKP